MKYDPRVKLCAIITLTTLAIYFKDLRWMIFLSILTFGVSLYLNADFKSLIKRFKKFINLLITICIIQIIFVRTGSVLVHVGDFNIIFYDGLARGIASGLRFFIILCSAAIMANENTRRVISSLNKMHIPYSFSFMVMIALRFLPVFTQTFKNALISIQLRGIDLRKVKLGKKVKLYSYLLLPVVSDAIVKSQELAMALEARGFQAYPTRTFYLDLELSLWDKITIGFLIILFFVLLFFYKQGFII